MDDLYFFNEHNFPVVYNNRSYIIDVGANILENLHNICTRITPIDFASKFIKKLTSNTGKECTTLRGKVAYFIMKVLINADMIQTKGGISCTVTYLSKFRKGKPYDFHSLMKKYIHTHLKFHWEPPHKRKRKARTSGDSLLVIDNMSNLTEPTTANQSLSNTQGNNSPTFDVIMKVLSIMIVQSLMKNMMVLQQVLTILNV